MVQLSIPVARHDQDAVVIETELSRLRGTGTLWYRLPVDLAPGPDQMADACFVIGLMLAMATDGELELDAPISPRLLAQSEVVQDAFMTWFPAKMQRVRPRVQARPRARETPRTPSPTSGARGFSSFTGGVDSFFTLHKNREKISHLLYVHGFDIALTDTSFRATTSKHLQEAATKTGMTLVEGSTNLRRFIDPHLYWGSMSHGAAIASFALLLGSSLDTFYFPASHTYADLYPWGSHPLLDPLWSTEYLRVVHDGAEATRVAKTQRIAHDPAARKHLRVCWQKTGAYNCGHCEKCVRTKISLELEGVLSQFETFDPELDLKEIREITVRNESDLSFAIENRDFARHRERYDLADALQTAIDRYQRKHTAPSAPASEASLLVARMLDAEQRQQRLEEALTDVSSRVTKLTRRVKRTEFDVQAVSRTFPLRVWRRATAWRRRFRR